MGLKPLSLQMIPWCFHVAGATCHSSSSSWFDDDDTAADSPKPSVRLVSPDGRIRLYHRWVSAAELMAAHPFHLLCLSDSFVIGEPIASLSPDDCLLPGHTYFLLPSHFFHSTLSFASLAACFGDHKRSGVATLLQPIEIHKTAAGKLQVRVSDEYLERLRRAEEEEAAAERRGQRMCTTEELAKDYKQLVKCRSWKPKLETIKESERRRSSSAGAAFGRIGRRKKCGHLKNNRNKENKG
ncbi:hypothetical protein OPV22_029106 [Ensete ventricosum]|uniref:DUF4228 domain-containing protein n=1 Tax=Ensete ventricosum TaxID=4639 RepID=A0AAV8QCJ4_ENSVE|nr:hypothetical protein OPV22_029106 [Ensete ventricosum]RWV76777.1 hypothetical protein GW17_00062504 [Ensete ventricosum]